MNLASSILGHSAVEKLRESAKAAVLECGSDRLTRHDLAGVDCFNYHAARLLSHVFKSLEVPNLRYVYDKLPPSALALPHVGVVSLAVLGAAFEAKGIGGETPLESYVNRHLREGGKIVTFYTLKHREQAEIAKERAERRRRKGQRRDQAHETRVDRYEARNKAS